MPRFVLEYVVVSATERGYLDKLAAERFPEIDIEDRRDERWVCRATSAAQLEDWLAGAGITDVRIVATTEVVQ